jgi:hypothetical protein
MANPPDKPIGQRFSRVYVERGEPVADSDRVRIRMRALTARIDGLVHATIVEEKLGLKFVSWRVFFETASTQDVLDLVTVAYQYLRGLQYVGETRARQWLLGVAEILKDENIHYAVDQRAGVHFSFDQEFARTSASAIGALGAPRYANSRDAFERSLKALAEAPPDGKSAIRLTFTAIEGLFCLMFPDVQRLASGIAARLRQPIVAMYHGDRRAQDAAGELVASFADWINSAHQYRHEEGKLEAIAQPPLSLAIHLISTGAAHPRALRPRSSATGRRTFSSLRQCDQRQPRAHRLSVPA